MPAIPPTTSHSHHTRAVYAAVASGSPIGLAIGVSVAAIAAILLISGTIYWARTSRASQSTTPNTTSISMRTRAPERQASQTEYLPPYPGPPPPAVLGDVLPPPGDKPPSRSATF